MENSNLIEKFIFPLLVSTILSVSLNKRFINVDPLSNNYQCGMKILRQGFIQFAQYLCARSRDTGQVNRSLNGGLHLVNTTPLLYKLKENNTVNM